MKYELVEQLTLESKELLGLFTSKLMIRIFFHLPVSNN